MNKKILLLSAYRSDSHASWADWLMRNLAADWRRLELPGRYFRWRIRGNPLSWLDALPQVLDHWQPERILATSMVDISTLKGLFPALASVPVSYYFHENQFAYPQGERQHDSVDPQMVQLYGALAADECLFNSDFNRQTFLSGIDALLKKLPDCKPDNLRLRLEHKCRILPVPVTSVAAGKKIPGLIVWNHRWEYDKKPELFLQIVQQLAGQGMDFRLALLGPRADKTPPALTQLRTQFADRILADGMVSRAEYEHWLGAAQYVISTAIHEFQGLSVQEAVSAGALPVVPDALCYREQYPQTNRYTPGDPAAALMCLQQAMPVTLTERFATAAAQWQCWLASA